MSFKSSSRKPRKRPIKVTKKDEIEKILDKCDCSNLLRMTKELLSSVPEKSKKCKATTIVCDNILDGIKDMNLNQLSVRMLQFCKSGCNVVICNDKGIPIVDEIVEGFNKYFKFREHKVHSFAKGKRTDIIWLVQK
jgi:hypothetical protein